MSQLYLWKLTRKGDVDYDQFRGMVVCASSEDLALHHIAREGRWSTDTDRSLADKVSDILEVGLPTSVEEYLAYEMSGFDETDEMFPRAHWTVQCIGIVMTGITPGIILSDMRHG